MIVTRLRFRDTLDRLGFRDTLELSQSSSGSSLGAAVRPHLGFLMGTALAVLFLQAPASAATLFGLVDTGELFTSSDNGVTWSARSTLPVRDAVALSARLSSSDLFLASRTGEIYRSTDSGVNWSAVGAIPVSDAVDLVIRPDGALLVLTATGSLYRSLDQGGTFTPIAALTGSGFVSLTFTTPSVRYYAATRTGEVFESQDGGSSWTPRSTIPVSDARRIRAIGSKLYLLTDAGDVYRSTNAGSSWTGVGALSQVGMRGLARVGIWLAAASREGHVATSTDGAGWTWRGSINQLTLSTLASDEPATTSVEGARDVSFALGAPAPNPSRDGASFELRLPAASDVSLALFDVNGRRVARQAPKRFDAGSHYVSWRPNVAASGLYFLRVENDLGAVATRRWVVIK